MARGIRTPLRLAQALLALYPEDSETMHGISRLRRRRTSTARSTTSFHFQRLPVFGGYGGGSFSRGSMSFAYGFSAEEAGPYLKLPEGKKLSHNGTELALVDV